MSARAPRAAAALLVAALAFAAAVPAPARGPHEAPPVFDKPAVVLQEQPVLVTAQLGSGPPEYFTARIGVSRGADRYELTSLVRPAGGGYDSAVAEARRSVGWKGPYLFVATSCGPGNAWKCASEAVFMVKGGRLVGLGSLPARERGAYGTSRQGGWFLDYETDFEFNDLTSHATAPGFDLLLRERDGRLVGDTDSTWALNAARFALNDSIARANTVPEITGYRRVWDFVIAPRIENVLLARWCARAAVAESVTAEARRILPPEAMAHWQEMLARVEPGALPRRSRLKPAATP